MFNIKRVGLYSLFLLCSFIVSESFAADYVTIKVKSSDKCIEMNSNGLLMQNRCDNSDRQQFLLTQVASGYQIITTKSHMSGCLTVPGASHQDNIQISRQTCNNQKHQQYSFVDLGGNYFTIQPVHSNKCLDVPNGDQADGIPVNQYSCDNSPEQSFNFFNVAKTTTSTATNTTSKKSSYNANHPTTRHSISNTGLTVAIPNHWKISTGTLGLSVDSPDKLIALEFGGVDAVSASSVGQKVDDELAKAGVINIQNVTNSTNFNLKNGKVVVIGDTTGQINNKTLDIGILMYDTGHGQFVLMISLNEKDMAKHHEDSVMAIIQSLK
ncbi:MAG: hypothetical protein ACI8P9_001038 [Parasphingorhabdus sp.]|jgi:hypothetical protein